MSEIRYILNQERELINRENKKMNKIFNKLKNFEKKQSKKFNDFEDRILSIHLKLNKSLLEIKNYFKKNDHADPDLMDTS